MAKGYTSIQHEMMISYMEARLVAEGRVNTTDATNLFGIARVNALKIIGEWQKRSELPVYESSEKAWIPLHADRRSKLFGSINDAAKYMRLVERVYRETAQAIKAWESA